MSNEYFEKGEDEKKAFLEGDDSSKWILSLVSPFQQFLGCSKKYSLQDTHIICLIGPQLELKLESDSSSKCALGFEKSENTNFCVFKKSDSVEVTYLGHPEEFVENLNVLRKKYSKKYHVPNTNQLIWTPELSKTAESLTWPNTSKWEDLNEKYRYTVIQSYRNPIEFLEELNEEDYEHSENHRELEFMVPGQKMIGYRNLNYGIFIQMKFLDPIVQLDMRTSMDYVLQKVWDKELEESAKHLPYNSQKPPKLYNKGFRWMKLATYNWHLDWIKEQFFDHISFKDKNEVAKWIDKQKPTSMGIFELFAKGQSQIGCAKRNTSAEMFILCLLGPESEFNLIALEKEYVKGWPKKAGSRCPTGYQNDDGLCRRNEDMPPKKTKKRRTRTTTTTTSASSTTRKSKAATSSQFNIFWILLLASSMIF
ncbi:unnamed protein product [Caenorhabditis nigoni]